MLTVSVLKHILGGHQKASNAEKKLEKLSSENQLCLCLFFKSPACLREQTRPIQKYEINAQYTRKQEETKREKRRKNL